jgi:hypothetical protein
MKDRFSWIAKAIEKQKRDMKGMPQSFLDAYAGKNRPLTHITENGSQIVVWDHESP